MDSGELKDVFRTEVSDVADPPLWADAEIYRYMDEAQKQFCRQTWGIGDASSSLTRLSLSPISTPAPVVTVPLTAPTITAAPEWVALSPLILKFRDAWCSDDGRPLAIVNYEDLPSHGIRFNGRTGIRPEAIVIGMEPGRARIYPAPTVDSVGFIQLVVDRLPLKSITDEGQKLEIAEQHHVSLMLWMKHRAYSKQDADAFDAKKANDFRAEFTAYCLEAKREKERAMSKVRVVQYGGIGGGSGGRGYGYGGRSCRW